MTCKTYIKRKTAVYTVTFSIILSLWLPHSAKAQISWLTVSDSIDTTWSGSGTAASPYIIGSAGELAGLAQQVNGGNSYSGQYFKMSASISLNNSTEVADWATWNDGGTAPTYEWIPIGTSTAPFSGNFDGGGHAVFGLYINTTSIQYVGLFGYMGANSSVSNLGLVYSSIYSSFNGQTYVGGLVGCQQEGTVANCYNWANITAICTSSSRNVAVGGIAGFTQAAIKNCYNNGTIQATGLSYVWAGGIAGRTEDSGTTPTTVVNSYNTGTIYAEANVAKTNEGGPRAGGIVGSNYSYLYNCYNVGYVSCNTSDAHNVSCMGGIEGQENSTVQLTDSCYWLYNASTDGIYAIGDINVGSNDTILDASNRGCISFASATASVGTSASLCDALNAYSINDTTLSYWTVNTYVNNGYPVFGTSETSSGSAGATSGFVVNGHVLSIEGSGEVSDSSEWFDYADVITDVILGSEITVVSDNLLAGLNNGGFVDVTSQNANCILKNSPSGYTYYGGIRIDGSNETSWTCSHDVLFGDKMPFYSPVAFTFTGDYKASYKRTLTTDYGTIILPFVPDTTGYKFFVIGNVTSTSVTFTEVESPASNTPYIYRESTDGTFPAITGTSVSQTDTTVMTVAGDTWATLGTFETQTLTGIDNYFITSDGGSITNTTGTLTVYPFRCWWRVNGSSAIQSFQVRFEENDITSLDKLTTSKLLVLFVEKECITVKANETTVLHVHAVNGKEVASQTLQAGETHSFVLPAGIYIVNGTKVLVK